MTIENFIEALELAKEAYPEHKGRDIYFFVEINGECKEFIPFIFNVRDREFYDTEIVLKPRL